MLYVILRPAAGGGGVESLLFKVEGLGLGKTFTFSKY